MNRLNTVFIAFSENSLGRRILNMMLEKGMRPTHVFMASEKALQEFRKNGIKRYLKNYGLINTIWRIYYRLTVRRDVRSVSVQNDEKLRKSIKELCNEHNIPINFFDRINDPLFVEVIKDAKPDLIVLGGAPLIKKRIIDLPTIGVINSHPGILPEAKGI